MNYQQKRHYETLLANKLPSIAHSYRNLAEATRLLHVQIGDLSQFVFGHRDANPDAVLAQLKRLQEPKVPREPGPEFQFDDMPRDQRYPAKRKERQHGKR